MNRLDFQDGMRRQSSCLQLLCRPELRDALVSLMNAATFVRLRLVQHQKSQRASVQSSVLCISRISWPLVALRCTLQAFDRQSSCCRLPTTLGRRRPQKFLAYLAAMNQQAAQMLGCMVTQDLTSPSEGLPEPGSTH